MTPKALSFCLLASLILISGVLPVQAQEQHKEITFNISIPGDRNLGQEYSWEVKNASGYAGCVYHYTVYDERIIGGNYTYHSPAWGQWFIQDAEPGKKYLAVWVRGWIEGQTTWLGWGQERFPLWLWDNTTVYPEPVHLQDLSVRYGSDRKLPAVIREIQERMSTTDRGPLTVERYGWKDEKEMGRMEPGRSNAFDGYILYQIPEQAQPEDIRVAGWFGYWGTAIWHLAKSEINQESMEKYRILETDLVNYQKEIGIRLSDRQPDRARA